MAYATLADILEQIDETTLTSLTDDHLLDIVDATAVERSIANADAVIDGYCGDRYTVPFYPVPPLVRMYSVDLAAYNLYSRRTHIDMPEVIAERQKQALAYLRLVQKGDASVGVAIVSDGGSAGSSALVGGNERIFDRQKMRGL
jgi:phage gp36-like protein